MRAIIWTTVVALRSAQKQLFPGSTGAVPQGSSSRWPAIRRRPPVVRPFATAGGVGTSHGEVPAGAATSPDTYPAQLTGSFRQ